jgi:hypothetical protein
VTTLTITVRSWRSDVSECSDHDGRNVSREACHEHASAGHAPNIAPGNLCHESVNRQPHFVRLFLHRGVPSARLDHSEDQCAKQ